MHYSRGCQWQAARQRTLQGLEPWTDRHSCCFLTQQSPVYVSCAIRGTIKRYVEAVGRLNSSSSTVLTLERLQQQVCKPVEGELFHVEQLNGETSIGAEGGKVQRAARQAHGDTGSNRAAGNGWQLLVPNGARSCSKGRAELDPLLLMLCPDRLL